MCPHDRIAEGIKIYNEKMEQTLSASGPTALDEVITKVKESQEDYEEIMGDPFKRGMRQPDTSKKTKRIQRTAENEMIVSAFGVDFVEYLKEVIHAQEMAKANIQAERDSSGMDASIIAQLASKRWTYEHAQNMTNTAVNILMGKVEQWEMKVSAARLQAHEQAVKADAAIREGDAVAMKVARNTAHQLMKQVQLYMTYVAMGGKIHDSLAEGLNALRRLRHSWADINRDMDQRQLVAPQNDIFNVITHGEKDVDVSHSDDPRIALPTAASGPATGPEETGATGAQEKLIPNHLFGEEIAADELPVIKVGKKDAQAVREWRPFPVKNVTIPRDPSKIESILPELREKYELCLKKLDATGHADGEKYCRKAYAMAVESMQLIKTAMGCGKKNNDTRDGCEIAATFVNIGGNASDANQILEQKLIICKQAMEKRGGDKAFCERAYEAAHRAMGNTKSLKIDLSESSKKAMQQAMDERGVKNEVQQYYVDPRKYKDHMHSALGLPNYANDTAAKQALTGLLTKNMPGQVFSTSEQRYKRCLQIFSERRGDLTFCNDLLDENQKHAQVAEGAESFLEVSHALLSNSGVALTKESTDTAILLALEATKIDSNKKSKRLRGGEPLQAWARKSTNGHKHHVILNNLLNELSDRIQEAKSESQKAHDALKMSWETEKHRLEKRLSRHEMEIDAAELKREAMEASLKAAQTRKAAALSNIVKSREEIVNMKTVLDTESVGCNYDKKTQTEGAVFHSTTLDIIDEVRRYILSRKALMENTLAQTEINDKSMAIIKEMKELRRAKAAIEKQIPKELVALASTSTAASGPASTGTTGASGASGPSSSGSSGASMNSGSSGSSMSSGSSGGSMASGPTGSTSDAATGPAEKKEKEHEMEHEKILLLKAKMKHLTQKIADDQQALMVAAHSFTGAADALKQEKKAAEEDKVISVVTENDDSHRDGEIMAKFRLCLKSGKTEAHCRNEMETHQALFALRNGALAPLKDGDGKKEIEEQFLREQGAPAANMSKSTAVKLARCVKTGKTVPECKKIIEKAENMKKGLLSAAEQKKLACMKNGGAEEDCAQLVTGEPRANSAEVEDAAEGRSEEKPVSELEAALRSTGPANAPNSQSPTGMVGVTGSTGPAISGSSGSTGSTGSGSAGTGASEEEKLKGRPVVKPKRPALHVSTAPPSGPSGSIADCLAANKEHPERCVMAASVKKELDADMTVSDADIASVENM